MRQKLTEKRGNVPYDAAFLRRFEELKARIEEEDLEKLYRFLREEFGFLF